MIVWGPDDDRAEIGVDWAKGTDITVYTCHACGFSTAKRDEFVHHVMNTHPRGVRLAPGTVDQVRRG